MDDSIGNWLGTPPEESMEPEDLPMLDIDELSDTPAPVVIGSFVIDSNHTREETVQDDENIVDEDDFEDVHELESVDQLPEHDETATRKESASPPRQAGLEILVPELDEDEIDEYEFLPDHFNVEKVYYVYPGAKVLVRLASGEVEMLDRATLIQEYENGRSALRTYQAQRRSGNLNLRRIPPMNDQGYINWNKFTISDAESRSAEAYRGDTRRQSRKNYAGQDLTQELDTSSDDNIVSLDDSEDLQPSGRRSRRLRQNTRQRYSRHEARYELKDLGSGSDIAEIRRGRRLSRKTQVGKPQSKSRARRAQSADSSADEYYNPAQMRRSERARRLPLRSMRERQEDEMSSRSEKDLAPKVVATKEVFERLSVGDPFRRRHQQQCSTCYFTGDSDQKGSLVFCQGCTNSYHKICLGPRGSREHLVTKVGDQHFVLQCRKCIGVLKEKDPMAPHYGRCVACNELNTLSLPLGRRISTKQEQIQREENGGVDPITITQKGQIDNPLNIMFRCATCSRAWHMYHLPHRKTVAAGDTDEEGLDEQRLAQKRFDHYHRAWICKDCVENQNIVDTIVAWRPLDQDSYLPGRILDNFEESQKEYLIKWKNQSYFRCVWMPGTWVYGIVVPASRASFNRKPENQLPKMTVENALPEEYFRVDIVFDVRYTSIVRNSSQGIDLARVKEVDTAFVKYKGLGYEDAIWEKPPTYTETDRFLDFKDAYEDYVKKKYLSVPPQSTLRRRLLEVRQLDFETKLIKKEQPPIMTGGKVMGYQLEGHNWLYYQWYRQHNAILADEMGLGKTIQLIALMATLVHEHKCWPFLIVVPNSTCPNWRREIKKWVPSLRAVCYYGSSAARKLTHDYELFPRDPNIDSGKRDKKEVKDIKAHIVIASYESIVERNTANSLRRVPWQGLIVDEGQRLKNDKNLVYEALNQLNFRYKVLMTGTPLQNNARELFNLLQFLDKEKHNAVDLEKKYAELTQENVPELHEMLKPYFLRRTKVQVLTFLPPMAQIIVPVSMSALQKKVSKSIMARNPELIKSIFSRDGNVPLKERASLNNILMQLRKTLCHPFVYSRDIEDRSVDSDAAFKRLVEASSKLQLLSIMLPKLRERGHRVLMFSQFLDNLDIVEDFLDGLGMLYRRLDGTISALEKQKRIDEFNAPNSPYFAFLLSTRAGGVGINLATADTVIILDPDFNPHQDIQALSRAHRIGQQNKVLVFQIMTRSSPEEKIMQIGKKKMALDHVLIEAMEKDDDAGMDLESILRHGAEALFADEQQDDIVYTEASIDALLDRSQIESTKMSEDQTAESQFSYARIWANARNTLEEGLPGDSGTSTPNPDIWDKILRERERAYEEEATRKAETLGRGKRKRGTVDYGGKAGEATDKNASAVREGSQGAQSTDDDFEDTGGDAHTEAATTAAEDTEPEYQVVHAKPYKRTKVPLGTAPHFNGDLPPSVQPHVTIPVPPTHHCQACKENHPMGWCRLKIAGVEHCGLCGLAHIGHGRTCPHLNDETQVEMLLRTLKESTESRELVEEARKYLTVIRGDLISQRRARERRAQQERVEREAGPRGTTSLPLQNLAPAPTPYGSASTNGMNYSTNALQPVMPPLPNYNTNTSSYSTNSVLQATTCQIGQAANNIDRVARQMQTVPGYTA